MLESLKTSLSEEAFEYLKNNLQKEQISDLMEAVRKLEKELGTTEIKLSKAQVKKLLESLKDGKGVDSVVAELKKLCKRYKDSDIKFEIIDGKVNGQIPVDEYRVIREQSIKNEDGVCMILGKYVKDADGQTLPESYTEMAKKYGDTYFDLGDTWNIIKEQYGLTDTDMFELFNKPVIDYAVESGKIIRFSHDPRNYQGSALSSEWNYLKTKYGYKNLEKGGSFWYAE